MSEAHTLEPWKQIVEHGDVPAVVPQRHGELLPDGFTYLPVVVCRMGVGVKRTFGEAEANARRIVLCVNALSGMPTENLEKLKPGDLVQVLAMITLGPMKGVCSWCGLELYGDTDPFARMKSHQMECPQHPMRAVERQRDNLLAACEAMLLDVHQYERRGGKLTDNERHHVNLMRAAVARAKGETPCAP